MKKETETKKWIDVTDTFSMERREYKDSFLEICEVYDNALEVSLFSRENLDDWEIYFGFGILTGIIPTSYYKEKKLRKEIKKDLLNEYSKHSKPSSEFIKEFVNKYNPQYDMMFSFEDFLNAFNIKL